MSLPLTDAALHKAQTLATPSTLEVLFADQGYTRYGSSSDTAFMVSSNFDSGLLALIASPLDASGGMLSYDGSGLFSGAAGFVLSAAQDGSGNVISASYAVQAGNYPNMNVGFATSAGSAPAAGGSADFAGGAGYAYNDGAGNAITTTYAQVASNTNFISVSTGAIDDSGTVPAINVAARYLIGADGSTTVLDFSVQGSAIPDPTGGSIIDVQARAQLALLLAFFRTNGQLAT